MPPYTLAIFDLDGTLVDSEPLANRVLAEHLSAIGVAMTAEDAAARFTGLRMPDCYALVEQDFGIAVPAGFHDRLQAETFARLRRDLQPMPGAAQMLAALEMQKVVASSSEPEKIALSLQATGLAAHFSRTYSGTQVARGKPAPDLFLWAAQSCETLPDACCVVEDSDPGVQAGLAAGMHTFALVPDSEPGAAGRRARLVQSGAVPIRDLRELPGLLR